MTLQVDTNRYNSSTRESRSSSCKNKSCCPCKEEFKELASDLDDLEDDVKDLTVKTCENYGKIDCLYDST